MSLKNLSLESACGLLFCYNEAHILTDSLTHYLSQGIDLVVFDNGSTDSSMEIVHHFQNRADELPGRIIDVQCIETESYQWRQILHYACDYMHRMLTHYDWILLIDADAFYHSPVEGMPLKEFLHTAKRHGSNVVDGRLFEFYPTPDDDPSIISPVERMRLYERKRWRRDHRLRAPQQKIFTYHQSIDFYSHDGHILLRHGARPHFVKFHYYHYPWVSHEHGIRKIFSERIPRYTDRNNHPLTHIHYLGLLPSKQDLLVPSARLDSLDARPLFISRFRFLCCTLISGLMNTFGYHLFRGKTIAKFFTRLRAFSMSCSRAFSRNPRLTMKYLAQWTISRMRPRSDETVFAGEDFRKSLLMLRTVIDDVVPQRSYSLSAPPTYHFLMANYCNAQCVFCNQDFSHESHEEMTFENFKTIMSHIPPESARIFYFSGGGEPLLCKDLYEITHYVNDHLPWIDIRLRTNGLLIKKQVESLARLRNMRLEVSIHGANEEANDRIIQRRGGTKEIFEGLELLKPYTGRNDNKIGVSFIVVVSQQNIDEVPRLIEKAAQLGVRTVEVYFSRYYQRKDQEPEDPSRNRFADSLYFHKQNYNRAITLSKKVAKRLGIRFIHEPLFFSKFKRCRCYMPWELVVIDHKGTVYPCCGGEVWFDNKVRSGSYNFGNLLKEHIHQCWNNASYTMIRRTCGPYESKEYIPECNNCHNSLGFQGPDVECAHILRANP